LAIDTERLKALANVRAENARRLTARMLSSADSAREQVRRRVAQGPGPRLEAIQAMLEDRDRLDEASLALAEVASEVRRISHGLYPAELADGGLAAVLTEAAEVPANRFPRSIEITAFLAAEGDSGARIRSEPAQLLISLTRPPRDTALLERVAVLAGTVEDRTITLPLPG
jgi:signal transduction histidine kinase